MIYKKFIITAPTTLFHVASICLGDATQWDLIATLNMMVDPFNVGTGSISLPISIIYPPPLSVPVVR